jgi:cytochrome P450
MHASRKPAAFIHPSIGLPLECVVPPTGLEIDGYHLPGGTIVGVNAWTAGHDRHFYGADADDWNPELWLADSVQRSKMERGILQVRISGSVTLPWFGGCSLTSSCL